ncbi:MAG TPA: hypothetical protein VFZ34_19005 [Blastocatellia bacterium]|nr:hypothetical protein [Blastocatellia bacterium]
MMRNDGLKGISNSGANNNAEIRHRGSLFVGIVGVKNTIRDNWLPDITMTILGGTVIAVIVNNVMKTQKGTIIGCAVGLTIVIWIIAWMWIRHLPHDLQSEVNEALKPNQTQNTAEQSNVTGAKKKFYVRIPTSLIFSYPGPILYVYNSKFGRLIASIGYAAVAEVANNRDTITKIQSLVLDVEYDQQWFRLHHLPMQDPLSTYWVRDGDLSKCTQLDFNNNSFDIQAKAKELLPGQSVRGWVFFEWPPELRDKVPHIGRIRIKVENTQGEEETLIIESSRKEEEGKASMEGGGIRFLQKDAVDLSQLKIMPHMDLLRGFREGTLK